MKSFGTIIAISLTSWTFASTMPANANPQKGWVYVGSVSLDMHAKGYMPEGEYFVRKLPMDTMGNPRFMMQSLAIEGGGHSSLNIADCNQWRIKEYGLIDAEGNQLPTGWDKGLKGSGYVIDNALTVVCR